MTPKKQRGGTVAGPAPRTRAASPKTAAKVSTKGQAGANLAGVPRAMREAKRWIVWRFVPNRSKPDRPHKVPVRAGWNNPAHWRTCDDAVAACPPGHHLGFVLGDGWAGVDVDGAWSDDKGATLRNHAAMVWDTCKGGYVERSPSRTGFKVFVQFDPADAPDRPPAVRPLPELGEHVGTEVYSARGRWFAVSGDKLAGCGGDPSNSKARKGWRTTYEALRGHARERVRAIDNDELANIGAFRPYTSKLEADLQTALSLLASDDRNEWVRFGIAIRAMGWTGEHAETAFEIWREWSERSERYAGERECRKRWDGFQPRGDVSVSAIFARAKEAAGDATGTNDAALLSELSTPIPLRDYGTEEFMQIEPKDPPQLVPGLLAPGLTLLFGRQKSGKTYMLLQLAVALATHGQFLGARVARPFRVKAYLLEEAGDPALQRARFAEMGFDKTFRELPHCKPNLVLAFGDLPPIDEGGLQRLSADLATFDAVLLDSATALDYGKVGRGELDVFRRHYREFSILQRAARKAGKCLFVLSHTRKGSDVGKSAPDDISDSTGGKAAAIDAYWALQEDPKRDAWRLTVRGRYKACAPLALRQEKDNSGHWTNLGPWDALDLTAMPADESEDARPTISEELVLVLDLCGPLETAELVRRMREHAESSVLAALRNMEKGGTVARSRAARRPCTMGRPGSRWSLGG